MGLVVFGATGRTGAAVLKLAAQRGGPVTAFVRDAARLASPIPGLRVVVGDVLDPDAVASAIASGDTVISALGGGGSPTEPSQTLVGGIPVLIAAMERLGSTRLLAVSGAGVLQADATRLRSEMPDYPVQFRRIGAQHHAMYQAMKASGLTWTLVCTPRIVDGAETGHVVARADYFPDGTGAITTFDLAAFLLRESDEGRFPRQRVGVNTAP